MNYRALCLFLLYLSFIKMKAQDTVYLSTIEGKVAKNKKEAKFYKIVSFNNSRYEVSFYYLSGIKISTEHFTDKSQKIYDGEYITYFDNGNINKHGNFKNNNMDGWWEAYHKAGNYVHTRQHFKDNLMDGESFTYYSNGKPAKIELYSNNIIKAASCFDSTGMAINCQGAGYLPSLYLRDSAKLYTSDTSGIYSIAEVNPEFPGGPQGLLKFLQINTKYPSEAREKGIQGKVIVKFIVDENGWAVNPTVIRDDLAGYGGANEAIRLVKLMPKWKPGSQKGKPVKVYYTFPITFKIETGMIKP